MLVADIEQLKFGDVLDWPRLTVQPCCRGWVLKKNAVDAVALIRFTGAAIVYLDPMECHDLLPLRALFALAAARVRTHGGGRLFVLNDYPSLMALGFVPWKDDLPSQS